MLKFIDARCRLGLPAVPKEGVPYRTEEIMELMDRCHIEKAIAYHLDAEKVSLQYGNAELVRMTEGNDRFLRQWVAIPSFLGEFPEPDAMIAQMKQQNVTSLRLSPKSGHFSMRPHSAGRLMEKIAECHIPVFMDLESEVDPKDVYTICKDYPDVNFVFCRSSYGLNRILAGVLDNCPNFHLGAGNYLVHNGISLFCKYYGAEKLVFDTGLPDSSAASAVSLILYADISQEEKELIAHGNIERLLAGVRL